MSDSKYPKPPPDDFGETTPNIKVPKPDAPSSKQQSSSDWEKTNYNYKSKDLVPEAEDWNKTSYNVPAAPKNKPSDYYSQSAGKADDWAMTDANINLPGNQSNVHEQSFEEEDYAPREQRHDQTTPFIHLPESEKEKVKFQEPKPPTNQEERKNEPQKKGGIPGWLWTVGGLLGMSLFAVAVIGLVYFIFLKRTGFEVGIRNIKPNTDVLVDGAYWGLTSGDGTVRLQVLRAGERTITFINRNFKCDKIVVIGADGDKLEDKTVGCTQTSVPDPGPGSGPGTGPGTGPGPEAPKECLPKFAGDYDTSRGCAETELSKIEADDKAGKPFTVNQLLYAMTLYIVRFDKNKATIRDARDLKFIASAAALMKKLPTNTKIEVGGHTDTDGGDKLNSPLSQNRATTVRNLLVQNGVNSAMLQTKGYGSSQPVAPNDTDDNKFRNRRISYSVR